MPVLGNNITRRSDKPIGESSYLTRSTLTTSQLELLFYELELARIGTRRAVILQRVGYSFSLSTSCQRASVLSRERASLSL